MYCVTSGQCWCVPGQVSERMAEPWVSQHSRESWVCLGLTLAGAVQFPGGGLGLSLVELQGRRGPWSPLTCLQVAPRILLPFGLAFPQVLWHGHQGFYLLSAPSLPPGPTPSCLAPHHLHPDSPTRVSGTFSKLPGLSVCGVRRSISPGSTSEGPGAQ